MHKSSLRSLIAFTVVLGFLTITAPLFAAGKESLLYSFNDNGADGYNPYSSLVFDTKGNLYGTTAHGGAHNGGTVFQLTPENGAWTETIIYSFCSVTGCTDGLAPYAGLTFDTAGNLYGTTLNGGAYTSACEGSGCGTVFELSPGTNGTWTETVLHSFADVGKGGSNPEASLIFDARGNLYGTTYAGGAYGYGTAFRLAPGGNGAWTEKVLYTFCSLANCTDGNNPWASLIMDAAGNFYSTTYGGGANGYGTVFQLVPGSHDTWTENVLYSFAGNGKDGYAPEASLIFDAAGNLYGTTLLGGASGKGCGGYGCGTVFELSPGTNGTWTENVLYNFCSVRGCADGFGPQAGLISDAAGSLFGTTYAGGSSGKGCDGYGCGTVFRLTLGAKGKWKEHVLHKFKPKATDGYWPYAGLIFDASGNLYGTTIYGGAYANGTVFEITP
jgi:uncharacterized repeat protein (TIGR03803 family)